MSDYVWAIVGMFVLIVFLSCCTQRGKIEWTFDGVHHTLKLGETP